MQARPARKTTTWMVAMLTALAIYFAFLVLPNWFPGRLDFGFQLLYLPSLLIVLPALVLAAVVGLVFHLRRRKHLAVAIVGIGGLALFGLGFLLDSVVRDSLPAGSFLREFDRAAWDALDAGGYRPDDITPRQKMLGDITRNVLPGRTRAEVERILGPADIRERNGQPALAWMIGPARVSFAPDFEYLLVFFDQSGRYQRWEMYTDG